MDLDSLTVEVMETAHKVEDNQIKKIIAKLPHLLRNPEKVEHTIQRLEDGVSQKHCFYFDGTVVADFLINVSMTDYSVRIKGSEITYC